MAPKCEVNLGFGKLWPGSLKLYWNTAESIPLPNVYGCFCSAVVATETVYVSWSQKYLLSGPLRKSFLIPELM